MTDHADGGEAGLSLSAEAMRRLADAATDSLMARLDGLRDDVPWRGATRAELETLLREPAPETGRIPSRCSSARCATSFRWPGGWIIRASSRSSRPRPPGPA